MAGISYSHRAVLLSLRLLEGKSKSVLISIFVLVFLGHWELHSVVPQTAAAVVACLGQHSEIERADDELLENNSAYFLFL